jgi:hypothetical protein
MDRSDIMMTTMFLFMGLLFGVMIQALFSLGARLDEITIDQARIMLCHDHKIYPCI